MKPLLIFAMALGAAFAQDAAGIKEARHRFDLVSTRAGANLHAADSIEWRLNQDGATLHPQLIALRLRIGASLEEAHDAISEGDLKTANAAMEKAEALVERFARRLGGE